MTYFCFCCPTCGGYKTVSKPPWVAGDVDYWVSSDVGTYPCPTCTGTGLIWYKNAEGE